MCARTNKRYTRPRPDATGPLDFAVSSQSAGLRHLRRAQSCSSQERTMQLTPLIAFHMSSAIAATSVGALTLWRCSGSPRPLLHRIAGYVFVLLMLGTAISVLFIRNFSPPNWSGFTPIHLLVPVTLGGWGSLLASGAPAHRQAPQHHASSTSAAVLSRTSPWCPDARWATSSLAKIGVT